MMKKYLIFFMLTGIAIYYFSSSNRDLKHEDKVLSEPSSAKNLEHKKKRLDTNRYQFLAASKESDHERVKEINKLREELSPSTIKWSSRLPKPLTPQEDAFLLILQSTQELNQEEQDDLQEIAIRFLSLDNKIDQYFTDCLEKLVSGEDQDARNFFYRFAKKARPNLSFSDELIDDINLYKENPHAFKSEDVERMRDILKEQSDLTFEEKERLAKILN